MRLQSKFCFYTAAIVVLLAFYTPAHAQSRNDGLFKGGESVNFIGNSITHGGEFHSYIFLYYATRFPLQELKFYNSGIWGDSANQMLRRMEKDILTHKARYAVVMAGMNDVNRLLYSDKRKHEAGIEALRQKALDDYQKNMEKLIVRLQQEEMQVILQKPSIYDQTAKIPMENMYGVNDALQKCCAIIDGLAAKYQLKVVDYYSVMNQVNETLQKKDSAATIVSYDRIHPATPGSFLMAAQFILETSPTEVSSISIRKRRVVHASHCKVTKLDLQKGLLRFDLEQESLPFPVPLTAREVAGIIDFKQKLNKETLKVTGLTTGRYLLRIDRKEISEFSSKELAEGINLSGYETPQYLQAKTVAEAVAAYRNTYRRLRDIKIVEINFLPKEYYGAESDKTMQFIQQLKAANDPVFTKNSYYFNLYFKSKPVEKQLEEDLEKAWARVYQSAKPVRHEYSLQLIQ